CSNGAEPYAIAMLCREINLKCSILGTDIDKESMQEAYEGIYDESALSETPSYYKSKYFEKVKEGYRVIQEIRNSVNFLNLDLKDADFKDKFDLIFCRNVLIYLNKEFQEKILESFSAALKRNGVLVLGKVESIPNNVKGFFKPINIRDRIYAKNDKRRKLGGMIHYILPENPGGKKKAKYADSGISILLQKMLEFNLRKEDLEAKMIGGATMFEEFMDDAENSVGKRNVKKGKEILKKLGIKLTAQDIGGNYGRSIKFQLSDGHVYITSYKAGAKII
ncbi:MAG: CheR family methyltransferase, partial [candidate division WOR-3 bacterium]